MNVSKRISKNPLKILKRISKKSQISLWNLENIQKNLEKSLKIFENSLKIAKDEWKVRDVLPVVWWRREIRSRESWRTSCSSAGRCTSRPWRRDPAACPSAPSAPSPHYVRWPDQWVVCSRQIMKVRLRPDSLIQVSSCL